MFSGGGVPLTEFFIEFILRDGLNRLRANPDVLNDIFEGFLDSYLLETYGTETLSNIRNYILNTEFHIVQGWPNNSTKVPCCSINILSSDELPNRALLSDVAGRISNPITPQVIVNDFKPTSYNSVMGFIEVPLAVDISNVAINHIFVDSSDEEFTITNIINTTTQKRIGIGTNQTVDISTDECFVKGIITEELIEKKQIPLQEKIVLGVHASDEPKACKYWYYVLLYILASNRDIFEAKGLQIHNTNISDFSRVLEYLPETWFSRFINLSFLTWMDWKADSLVVASGSAINIRVDKDIIETPISSLKSIITTE